MSSKDKRWLLAGAGILERSPRGLKRQTTGCRWRFISEYFGEPEHEECQRCDNCEERAAGHFDAARPTAIATPPATV